MDLVVTAFRVRLRTEFRGLRERSGLLLAGPDGIGEFSPFLDYPGRLDVRWLEAAREAASGAWPPAVRNTIPVNAIVPAVDPERAREIVEGSGCTTVKVKVGDPGAEARVEAVRDALGPAGHIRIDANARWDVDTAVATIRRLARYDLEYVEQPVGNLDDMARVRARVEVPIAADESLRLAEDPRRVDLKDGADLAVLKVHPLGGVAACLEIAEALDIPVVVSSALETSVGLAAGVALAAALPELPYACGLGTGALLADDVVVESLVPADGEIEVGRISQMKLRAFDPTAAIGDETSLRARLGTAEAVLESRV